MTTLIFLLILSFLVLIHEFGHFWTAKKFKMKVEEFGMGYPPRAWKMFTDKDGTEYTWNWLPFGGFVRLYGENGPDSTPDGKKGAFYTKPPWQRLVVILAGVFMNFVFAIIAFSLTYTVQGIPTFAGIQVIEINEGSPADQAGLEEGDVITAIGAAEKTGELGLESAPVVIENSLLFIEALRSSQGSQVTLAYIDASDELEKLISLYVRTNEEIPEGQGMLGIRIAENYEQIFYPRWEMPFRGIATGMEASYNFSLTLLNALGDMFSRMIFQGEVPQDVAGPVGIIDQASETNLLTTSFWDTLIFSAIISLNLAVVNLLPIPALDGGRAVFLIYEMITRRRVPASFEAYTNYFGFILLLGLIVLITARDIWRLFL